MKHASLYAKASSLRGCLWHLRTTKGRRQFESGEDPLVVENDFLSDEAKIDQSKAFRLLSDKTQVVTAPINPFIRKRHSHVIEVKSDSVVLAEMLGLNDHLARSIALGHDIGHVPFGHPGENYLKKAMGRPEFCHEILGPLVAQKIERRGKGLNLTFETLDGMMRHSGNMAKENMSQEAWLVRYTDKFAYIFHDYNDLTKRTTYPLPSEVHRAMAEFGENQRLRTSTAMSALVVESAECGKVSFEHSEIAKKFKRLRELMMGVYVHVTEQDLEAKMEPVLNFLARLNIADPFLLISLMTDQDVIRLSQQVTKNITHLTDTTLGESLQYIAEIEPLDLCNPYLDW